MPMNARSPLRFLLICAAAMICSAVSAADDKINRALIDKIERYARGFDMNRQDKYHIDFSYSPVHAMAVYRELLLWSDGDDVAEAVRAEVRTTIAAGVLSVIRDSNAGPVKKDGVIGIGYVRAMPRYAQEPDTERPETLAWRSDGTVTETTPAVIGSSLSAKSLLLTRITHDATAHQAVLASLRNEYGELANLLHSANSTGYVPEAIEWNNGWKTKDSRSRLFSQAILLRGLVELRGALEKEGETKWLAQVDNNIERLFDSLVKHHFDAKAGSFVSVYDSSQGRGRQLMVEDYVQVMEALAAILEYQAANKALLGRAQNIGKTQLEYVLRVNGKSESLPRGYDLKTGGGIPTLVHSLEEPVAMLSTMQLASMFGVVGGERTKSAKERISTWLEQDFWSDDVGVYRTAEGFTVSAYDGYLFALTLRWLRRNHESNSAQRATKLIDVVLKQSGLLQCEPPGSGEPLSLDAALQRDAAELAARISTMTSLEQGVAIAEFVHGIADQDHDGVPGCRFAGGRFGGAPVPVVQTSVRTPYPEKAENRQ